MHGQTSNVYFRPRCDGGLDCLLAITYAVIISEKVNRAVVALLGAALMVVVGVKNQEEALQGSTGTPSVLLTGMMILVSISRRSGMFQYVAVWSAKAAKAHPDGIQFLLQITTAVLSALLDNVTTVLLIVPVTLAICERTGCAGLSLLVRRDLRLQHWRHRYAHRGSAQHLDRIAGRPRLQWPSLST